MGSRMGVLNWRGWYREGLSQRGRGGGRKVGEGGVIIKDTSRGNGYTFLLSGKKGTWRVRNLTIIWEQMGWEICALRNLSVI